MNKYSILAMAKYILEDLQYAIDNDRIRHHDINAILSYAYTGRFYICSHANITNRKLLKETINKIADYGDKYIPEFVYNEAFYYNNRSITDEKYNLLKKKHLEDFIEHLKMNKLEILIFNLIRKLWKR